MSTASRSKYLFNYTFLSGLLVLACNDHIWKAAYGNWLTGKLSDLAGVLILPLLLKYLFNWRNRIVLLATVAFFTWWKSPLADGTLHFLNSLGSYSFHRVVDYTDLL
ncbi:MAG: hypothetical protein AAF597_04685, partial [Bacteroidota bacterium]